MMGRAPLARYRLKGLTYRPDVRSLEIFDRAIAEAHAYMVDGWRHAGFEWWPKRKWRFPVGEDVIKTGGTFIADERVLLDERAFNFFGAFGMSRYPQPNLYVMTFEDSRGELLSGGSTYRLRVPADVPTKQFWSVVAYDTESAAFIREAPVVGLDSYNPSSSTIPMARSTSTSRRSPLAVTRRTGSRRWGTGRSSSCSATTRREDGPRAHLDLDSQRHRAREVVVSGWSPHAKRFVGVNVDFDVNRDVDLVDHR